MKYNGPYDQPTLPNAQYVNGDPAVGLSGSIPSAAAVEYPQRELQNFFTDSALVPTNADLHQLSRGVQNGVVLFGQDTGTANAMVAAMNPVTNALYVGMVVRVKKIASANTGVTTLDIGGGFGAKTVKRSTGADLAAGDLPANTVAAFIYDGTFWQMINFQGFSVTSSTINNFIFSEPYCVDAGTANHIIAPFSPVLTAINAGDRIKVKIAATNTGATNIAVNGIAVKNVVRHSGLALLPNDIRAGQILTLIYDGTNFQINVNSQLVWIFDIGTPPGSPATLLPGEHGILTFNNVTTLDFHVGLSPGVYTVELTVTSSTSKDANNYFRPNGTLYPGKLSTWIIQPQTEGTFDESSNTPYVTDLPNVTGVYQNDRWEFDLFDGPTTISGDLNDAGPFQMRWDISTFTPKKMIRCASGIHGGPSLQWGLWDDSVVWATLGTFQVGRDVGDFPSGPFASLTGRATVRRLI